MASPYSFHERASPVSDTVALFFSASGPALPASGPRPQPSRLRPSAPRPYRFRPLPSAYAFCSLAVRFDSMVKMAS